MKFFKRFYNPFKPHIVQLRTGEYVIRKFVLGTWFTFIGYEYLDSDATVIWSGFWWHSEDAHVYCLLTSIEEAKRLLNIINEGYL